MNLTEIILSFGNNTNVTFETGLSNQESFDSAPDKDSFLSYDAILTLNLTASLGTNPVPGYGDTDGSIVFDLKCSNNTDID